MSADADLPWYYGTASRTAAGDLGMRSTFGLQLSAARASQLNREPSTLRRPGLPWESEAGRAPEGERVHVRPLAHCVDASQVEDGQLETLWHADRIRAVEARLAAITATQRAALKLHYAGGSLPYGLDPAAVLLRAARELCGTGDAVPPLEVMRGALHRAGELQRAELCAAADSLVESARAAYEAAPVARSRPVQVDDPRRARW